MKSSLVKGFTLIELLVVIAIISLLASVVMASLNSARAKSQTAKSQADLRSLRTAVALLEDDTGKWPNGCPIDQVANPEVFLDSDWAGIKLRPQPGLPDPIYSPQCEWTAQEVARWKGPYATNTVDAWGTSYFFDPDYCDESAQTRVAILSLGPNKIEEYKNPLCGYASSDDITLYLK